MIRESVSRERITVLFFYSVVILVVYLSYLIFSPFITPLAWAAVLVIVTYPLYEKLESRLHPAPAAFVSTIGVLLILIVPMIFVMISFVKQGVGAAQAVQFTIQKGQFGTAQEIWDRLVAHFPTLGSADLPTSIQNYGEKAAAFVAISMGTILKHTAIFFFDLFVMTLAMFYFYRDGESFADRFRELLPFARKNRERMLEGGRDVIFASVTSSLITALSHGVFGGLIFLVIGVKSPLFWGVMMGFFSFIPVLGSVVIWVPISLNFMITGHMTRGILVLALCSLEVVLVDNFLRPLLISDRSAMSGLVVFIGVIGGIEAFGLLGIVLGPIIATMAQILLEVYAPSTQKGNNKSPQRGKETSAVLE